jgi:ATP-binding cassette subfamily A (ABC1) protein 3
VYNVSVGGTIGLYALDCLIYMLLTWYFEKVIPSEYGTTKKWYFLFTREYWKGEEKTPGADYERVGDGDEFAKLVDADTHSSYQKVGDEFEKVDGVRIRHLRKEFNSADNKLVAVQSLDLDMFKGEVFALLGHNGAGK